MAVGVPLGVVVVVVVMEDGPPLTAPRSSPQERTPSGGAELRRGPEQGGRRAEPGRQLRVLLTPLSVAGRRMPQKRLLGAYDDAEGEAAAGKRLRAEPPGTPPGSPPGPAPTAAASPHGSGSDGGWDAESDGSDGGGEAQVSGGGLGRRGWGRFGLLGPRQSAFYPLGTAEGPQSCTSRCQNHQRLPEGHNQLLGNAVAGYRDEIRRFCQCSFVLKSPFQLVLAAFFSQRWKRTKLCSV